MQFGRTTPDRKCYFFTPDAKLTSPVYTFGPKFGLYTLKTEDNWTFSFFFNDSQNEEKVRFYRIVLLSKLK